MRILHTSDWHVGKRLMGRERLQEQAEVLDEIIEICEREQIELVLIAGDIFDTYTPSAEAEELFYSKIKKVAGSSRSVLLISGNHDDGVRLSAIAPLAEEQGVYVVGNARLAVSLKRSEKTNRLARPISSGKGYVVFENQQGEKAFIATLPYPNEARFKEEKSDLPYVERMQNWLNEGLKQNVENLPSVVLAHIFVAGGVASESEREIDLGGARAFPVDALPKVDYIALGHLHKKQHMGKGYAYYSGSPLQYSFDESADKGVKIFDLTANGAQNVKDVPLTKGKKLLRLQATDVESATELLSRYPDALIELKLLLNAPLSQSETAALSQNTSLVSLVTEISATEQMEFESRKGLSDGALFDAYCKASYGAPAKPELKELFLSTLLGLESES